MGRSILALAASVVADAVRRKVVYIVLAFSAVLAAMVPQIPTYGAGLAESVFREVSLALVFVVGLVLALSLAANRVPGEIERRTVYNVLAKRVHRWEYLVGTWLGIFAVLGMSIAAFTLVTQGVALLRYGQPMWRLWEGALAIWLEMGALTAFAVAVSAVIGPVVVVTATLAFLFVAHNREGLLGANASGIAGRLYPSFDTFNVINPVAHGSGISAAYAGTMLVVFAAWSALLLLIGSVLFARKDL